MRCARCKSTDVRKFEGSMSGFCPVCNGIVELEYGDRAEQQSMQIFFSYGHDTHQVFVRRLADAIMQKTDNRIKVWIDTRDIDEGSHWRDKIMDGILNSRSVLAFLSQYSAREKGVCLDELAIALSSKHGMIKTVLLERSNTFTPPALVTEYQWADMSNYHEFAEKGEEAFAEYIDRQADRIIAMLDSDEVTQYNNELSLLRKKLALPEISYEQPRLNRLLKTKMVGRVWLTDMVNAWIEDTAAKPVLMLYGKPGAGKSMFSAHLQHYNPHVAASFACNHQSDEFSDTDKIITWLAYKLAMRLPDYRRQLLKLFDDPHFDTGTRRDRFDRLIAQPLSLCINGNRAPMMIIIDALDEAKGDEMAGFISDYVSLLPPWLRILITARKEPHITERFKIYPHIDLAEESEHNEADIREYYELHLHNLLDRQSDREAALQRLLHASEGVFLYAEEICPILLEEAKKGDLDLLTFDLPQGMDNLFHFSMKRKDFTYHKDGLTYHYTDFWRDPLGMIVAAPSPLPVETLKTLMGWDENDLHTFRLPLSALLTETDGCLQTFHRSFGEWLDKTGEFRSSTQDGLVNLANRAFAVYQTGVDNLDEYLLCNLTLLLRKANLQDAYQTATADEVLIKAMYNLADEFHVRIQLEHALQISEELKCILENNQSISGISFRLLAHGISLNISELKNAFTETAESFNSLLQVVRKIMTGVPENSQCQHKISLAFSNAVSIQNEQNDFNKILMLYAESLDIYRSLVTDFAEYPEYRYNLAVFLNKFADLLQAKGEFGKAQKLYDESLKMRRQLVDDFAENADYRHDLLTAIECICNILYENDKFNEAIVLYNELAERYRRLAEDYPENPAYRLKQLFVLRSIVLALKFQNKLEEALRVYDESLRIARKLIVDFPENSKYLFCLSRDLVGLADILQKQNKWNEALKHYTEALKIRKCLTADFPEDLLYRNKLSELLEKLDDIPEEQNEMDAAIVLYKEVLQCKRMIAENNPDDMNVIWDLAISCQRLADMMKKKNLLAGALDLYEESMQIYKTLTDTFPDEPNYQYGLTLSLHDMAEVLQLQGKKNEALKYYTTALKIAIHLDADFPQNPRYKNIINLLKAEIESIESENSAQQLSSESQAKQSGTAFWSKLKKLFGV